MENKRRRRRSSSSSRWRDEDFLTEEADDDDCDDDEMDLSRQVGTSCTPNAAPLDTTPPVLGFHANDSDDSDDSRVCPRSGPRVFV